MAIMRQKKKIFLSQFFFLQKVTESVPDEVIYMVSSNQMFTENLATAHYT